MTEHSRLVEQHWLFHPQRVRPESELRELADLGTLATLYAGIEHMRVVPFDLRSFGQLVGSTVRSRRCCRYCISRATSPRSSKRSASSSVTRAAATDVVARTRG